MPKSTVVGRENTRSSSGGEISMDDTAVFPPLRKDPNISNSHSTQGDRNGKVVQIIGVSEEVITGEQIRSSRDVREVPRSILKRSSSSSADPQNHVLPKSGYSGLAHVDPAVLKDFKELRSEHYALKQLDNGGRMDPSASEYIPDDQNLGFVDARSIEVGIDDQNLPVSKCGVSGLDKGGAELGRDSNGKPSLSVTSGNHSNDPMSFPATKKAISPDPYEQMGPFGGVKSPLTAFPGNVTIEPVTFSAVVQAIPKSCMLVCPSSGVQSDTFSAGLGSPKRGTGIIGNASYSAMGDRVGEYNAGSNDRLPKISIMHDEEPVLTQYMAGAMQVEAPLNPRKSMAGALQVDTPLTQSLGGAMQVEAPLNSNPRSMAGALQVEAPLNSSPCHFTNGASKVSGRTTSSMAGKTQGKNNHSEGVIGAPNWKSLFSIPSRSSSPLVFSIPSRVNGRLGVKPPDEAVFEGVGLWQGCLVGQFFDKRIPLHVVKLVVDRLWGKHEMPEITTTDNGLYIFKFRDHAARDWVMESGPWYIAGRPLILRVWKPGMEMLNVHLTSLPIWVKFYNIPLEYWTNTSLGYIASSVGKPLHLDSFTENHTRLSFARICIEIDMNCEFPKSILLDLGNGNFTTVRIEYPWVPQRRTNCRIFGHNSTKCSVNEKKCSPDSGAGETGHTNVNEVYPMPRKAATVDDTLDRPDDGPSVPTNKGHHRESNLCNTTDSIVECIDEHMNSGSPGKADYGKMSGNLETVPIKVHDNTFDCLASSEGVSTISISEEPMGLSTTLPITDDYSDTSPTCDTFKQVKRIDEMDYSSSSWSKSKRKKMRRRNRISKSVMYSNVVDTNTLSND